MYSIELNMCVYIYIDIWNWIHRADTTHIHAYTTHIVYYSKIKNKALNILVDTWLTYVYMLYM